MISELKEILANAITRVLNPILSSFVFSWLIINYKVTLVIFSSLTYNETISIIENEITNTRNIVIYPLLYSAFYTIGLPLFDLIYVSFITFIANKKELIMIYAKEKRPFSVDQASARFHEYKSEIQKLKKEQEELLETYNQNTTQLEKKLADMERVIAHASLCMYLSDKKINVFSAQDKSSLEYMFNTMNFDEELNSELLHEYRYKEVFNLFIQVIYKHYEANKLKPISRTKLYDQLSNNDDARLIAELVINLLLSMNIIKKSESIFDEFKVTNDKYLASIFKICTAIET